MNSWDCFDTLVTRRYLDPLSVFDDMEKKLSLSQFTLKRKSAERRSGANIDCIYEELSKDYGWSVQQSEYYKNEETEAEIEHCCPITQNINRVEDGDIIVSDMYLPELTIEKILRKNGLKKDVKIFVSSNGKSSGTIWSKLPKIDLHIGDNHHSDILSPQKFGIKTEFSSMHLLNSLEKTMDKDLAHIARVTRLACPYEMNSRKYHFWMDQSQLNIPILILASLELPEENLCFNMRDCVHLQPIHEAITGKKNKTLHSSRVAYKLGGEEFKKHVEENALGRTVVDLHGTGKSISEYFNTTFNASPNAVYVNGLTPYKIANATTDAIEYLNSSSLGSVSRYPKRFNCEFDADVLEAQSEAVNHGISQIKFFNFEKNNLLLDRLIEETKGSFSRKTNRHVNQLGQEKWSHLSGSN